MSGLIYLKNKWIVPLLVIATARTNVFLTSGCRAQDNQTTNPPLSAATNSVPAFTCSMHPEVVSNFPGDGPKCGMHLRPKS